jgi:hypothetical protein
LVVVALVRACGELVMSCLLPNFNRRRLVNPPGRRQTASDESIAERRRQKLQETFASVCSYIERFVTSAAVACRLLHLVVLLLGSVGPRRHPLQPPPRLQAFVADCLHCQMSPTVTTWCRMTKRPGPPSSRHHYTGRPATSPWGRQAGSRARPFAMTASAASRFARDW